MRRRDRGSAAPARRPTPGRIALLVAQVCGLLGRQAPLEHGFDHLWEEATVAGQRELSRIDLRHDLIQQAGLDHAVHRVPRGHRPGIVSAERTASPLIIGHGHLCTPQLERILLHRPSDRLTHDRTAKIGFDYVHSLVDDHSRLAYCEALPDEKGPTCAAFLARAADYFAAHGITRIERVMTDNAWAYKYSLRDVVTALDARQVFIKPHCPLRFPRFSGVFQDWFDLESQEGRHCWQHRRSTPMSCASARCGCIGSRPRARRFGGWASS